MKFLTSIVLTVILLNACQNNQKKYAPQSKIDNEVTFTKEGELTIIDSLGQIKAKFDIEFARDDYERETGLMYRKSMKDNQAMLFIFEDEKPRYFWMKNTYIPLDIVYVNANKRIVSIAKNAKPLDRTSLASKQPAMYVLEMKAGLSETYNLQKGDNVTW